MAVSFEERKRKLDARSEGVTYPVYPQDKWPGVEVTLKNIGTMRLARAIERHERTYRARHKIRRNNDTGLEGQIYALREGLIEASIVDISGYRVNGREIGSDKELMRKVLEADEEFLSDLSATANSADEESYEEVSELEKKSKPTVDGGRSSEKQTKLNRDS